jgi:drug/metabolite transporter (DMT)-like permease
VFAGWLILGDQMTPNFLIAVALVAAGILTINWPAKWTPARGWRSIVLPSRPARS